MAIGLLGRKVGMTQIYDDSGTVIPVTVMEVGPCHVLQLRTVEQDGYEAVQLGFRDMPRRRAKQGQHRPANISHTRRGASRSRRGHVANIDSKRSKKRAESGDEPRPRAGCEPKRFVREIRGAVDGYEVGQELNLDALTDIKRVDVVGTSKGRGTAGAMKRHNFHGQRASHGVKKVHRHVGSIGCSAYPSRVPKGHRMAGQYGNARCTTRNLQVVRVDKENNLLLVRGAVPGPNGGYVIVRETNKL